MTQNYSFGSTSSFVCNTITAKLVLFIIVEFKIINIFKNLKFIGEIINENNVKKNLVKVVNCCRYQIGGCDATLKAARETDLIKDLLDTSLPSFDYDIMVNRAVTSKPKKFTPTLRSSVVLVLLLVEVVFR